MSVEQYRSYAPSFSPLSLHKTEDDKLDSYVMSGELDGKPWIRFRVFPPHTKFLDVLSAFGEEMAIAIEGRGKEATPSENVEG